MTAAAIPLDEPTLERVKALGAPRYLVVGHSQHAIDGPAFAERLGLCTFAPAVDLARLRKRIEAARPLEEFPDDRLVEVESAPGTKHHEAMMRVQSGNRVSLLFADVIQNSPKETTKPLFRLLGFAGGPKVVWVYRTLFMSDRLALRTALLEWADIPQLHRLVPCHGSVVEGDAVGRLRAAAVALR